MRRATGLEAAVVDRSRVRISSLEAGDSREIEAWVAGPAALVVSKLHKIAEREHEPGRLNDKDAHDVYRLLVAVSAADLARSFDWMRVDPIAGEVTLFALAELERLFARSPEALGAQMAGRAESGVGSPEVVSASVAALAADVLAELERL